MSRQPATDHWAITSWEILAVSCLINRKLCDVWNHLDQISSMFMSSYVILYCLVLTRPWAHCIIYLVNYFTFFIFSFQTKDFSYQLNFCGKWWSSLWLVVYRCTFWSISGASTPHLAIQSWRTNNGDRFAAPIEIWLSHNWVKIRKMD